MNNKQHNFGLYVLLLGIFVMANAISYAVVKDAVEKTVENQAISVAEIVATQAATARSVYTLHIVEKLKRDGFGPHVSSNQIPGFVPIPAQFLKMLGEEAAANTSDLFHYKPVSKWNLEPKQGISDDFLNWAWLQLESQDVSNPAGPIDWKPVWRFEIQNNKKVLRYLRADPATQQTCVDCHNSYESSPEIVARRVANGVMPGKLWKQHQLLGALSVTIPLDKVQYVASEQVRITTLLIFAILLTSFLLLAWFSMRLQRQERSMSNLSWQALHDPLTRFLNRRGFEIEIKKAFKVAKSSDANHVILIVDIDNFKNINDVYGHRAGDEILRQLGAKLPDLVHAMDVIARLGGDEFAILLIDCNEKRGHDMAEKIRQGVLEASADVDGNLINATVSIGMAVMNKNSDSTSEVLNAADIACYISKKAGRNTVHVYQKDDKRPD